LTSRVARQHELEAVGLFAGSGDDALAAVAAFARVLKLARKESLFQEGEPYRGMFVVLAGLAVAFKLSAEGRMLILHVCRPGDSVGEVPLFEERDAGYPAHARVTRDSELLFLPRDPFASFVRTHPEVAWRLSRSLAARIKEMGLRLEGVTLREVSSRLARYLLREIDAAGEGGTEPPVLTLPIAKGAVASYLGTAHETLSRTFARLVRERIIRVDGPRVTILDKARLKRLL